MALITDPNVATSHVEIPGEPTVDKVREPVVDRTGEQSTRQGLLAQNEPGPLPSETTTVPETQAGSTYITPEATVQHQLSQILETGSPLQTLAEQRSKAQAQRSGLLSSSMAVGAGQQALYDSALKVATPDAATFAKAGLTQQQIEGQLTQTGFEGDISSRLVGQKGDIESRQIGEKGDIVSRQIGEKGDIVSRQIGEQGDVESRQIGERGDIEKEIQAKQIVADKALEQLRNDENFKRQTAQIASTEGISQDKIDASMSEMVYSLGIEDANIDARLLADITIANAQLDQEDREAFQTNVQTVWANYNRDVASIQGNPDLKQAEKEQWLEQNYYAVRDQIDFMAGISGQTVDWDDYGGYGDAALVEGEGGFDTGTGVSPEPTTTPTGSIGGSADPTASMSPGNRFIAANAATYGTGNTDNLGLMDIIGG